MSVLILNGFDRCGSSAISRTLSKHPNIELIFQPFNGGSIRKKMYQIFDNEVASKEDGGFYQGLSNGVINEEYINSEWYYKYSTTRCIEPGKLNLIKTTINHYTAEWHQKNYPGIGLWGIWRNPYDILNSIMRNHFSDKWYGQALKEIIPSLESRAYLKEYKRFIPYVQNDLTVTAFLIAVRSHYFFLNIPSDRIIKYNGFVNDPNLELGSVLKYYDLEYYDFESHTNTDFNVIGKKYEGNDGELKGSGLDPVVDEMFGILSNMMKNQHNLSDE